MSDSNNVIMLESRIQELQTENNKLKSETNLVNKVLEEILSVSNKYVPKDEFQNILDKLISKITRQPY